MFKLGYMMLNKNLFTALFLLFSLILFSQNPNESFEKLLSSKTGDEKVKLLHNISQYYLHINPDKAVVYAEELIKLINTVNQSDSAKNTYKELLGDSYYNNNEFQKALNTYRTLYIDYQIYNNLRSETRMLIKITRCHMNLNDLNSAKKNLIEAKKNNKTLKSKSIEAKIDFEMAEIALEESNTLEAEKWNKQAFNLFSDLNDKLWIAESYNQAGKIFYYAKEYEKALNENQKALQLRLSLNRSDLIALSYYNNATYYSELRNPEKSILNSEKALEIYRKNEDYKNIVKNYYALATVYFKFQKKELAIVYYKKALNLSIELEDYLTAARASKKIGQSFHFSQTDSTDYYVDMSKKYFKKEGQHTEIIDLISWQAHNYIRSKDYYNSIKLRIEAINLARDVNYNEGLLSNLYLLGTTYQGIHQYKLANEALLSAYEIGISLNESQKLIQITRALSRNYKTLNKFDDAIKYAKINGELSKHSSSVLNVIIATQHLGEIYLENGEYAKAEKILKKNLEYTNEKFATFIANTNVALGNLFIETKKYNKALKHYQNALPGYKQNDSKAKLSLAHFKLGRTFFLLKQHEEAEKNLIIALDYASSDRHLSLKSAIFYALYDIYKEQGQTQKALDAYINYNENESTVLKEQIKNLTLKPDNNLFKGLNMNPREEILTLNAEMELFKQKNEISKLEKKTERQKKYIRIFIIFSIALFCIILALAFITNKLIKKNKENSRIKIDRLKNTVVKTNTKLETLSNIRSNAINIVEKDLMTSIEELKRKTNKHNAAFKNVYIDQHQSLVNCYAIWAKFKLGNYKPDIEPIKINQLMIQLFNTYQDDIGAKEISLV